MALPLIPACLHYKYALSKSSLSLDFVKQYEYTASRVDELEIYLMQETQGPIHHSTLSRHGGIHLQSQLQEQETRGSRSSSAAEQVGSQCGLHEILPSKKEEEEEEKGRRRRKTKKSEGNEEGRKPL